MKKLWGRVTELMTVRVFIGSAFFVLAMGAMGFCLDDWAYGLVKEAGQGPAEYWAEKLSFFGDFLPGTLPLGAILWLGGWVLKKVAWQRAALACLLAAVLAGGLVNIVRLTAGRTRPDATLVNAVARLGHVPRPIISFGHLLPDGQLEDGFYGPQRPAMFQGFPSGHSATSVATATVLVVTLPELGLLVTPVAVGVCWSRLYLHKHHLSDVLVGASLGLVVGLLFGRAAGRSSWLVVRCQGRFFLRTTNDEPRTNRGGCGCGGREIGRNPDPWTRAP